MLVYDIEPGVLLIKSAAEVHGDFYVGDSVFVEDSTRVGLPLGADTQIMVGLTDTVFFYNNWRREARRPVLKIKQTAAADSLDSLITIAAGINTYIPNNKFVYFSPPSSLNLSLYSNNRIFVRNSITFRGGTVDSMTTTNPGMIICAGNITIKNSNIRNNILLLASGSITVTNSTIGKDFSNVAQLPVNMLWSHYSNIIIQTGSHVYANCVAYRGNSLLAATLYGGLYTKGVADLSSSAAHLEGSF